MRPVLCPVLVGRADESHHILSALAQVRAGSGRTILLAGEAGIGKTRLAREAASLAEQQGCVVLVGRAVASGVPTPFRPFAEALAAALRPGGLPDRADLGPFLPAIGRLVPHLRPESAAPPDEADSSLVFLGEAVLRLLRALAGTNGCLLVLEDLHWADAETLALVEYLADNSGAEPVLCLGTFRPEEGDAAALAAKLEARDSADVLSLPRLDQTAVALMAQACLGPGDGPDQVIGYVARRAEGIPFLVEELLAGLVEQQVLVDQDGRWEATGPPAAQVPATFADAVARRVAGLDPESRLVIGAAAVLGRQFEWSLLGPMLEMDDSEVAAALRAAVGMQLVTATGDHFRFRHALTHEAVLAGLLPPERSRLAGLALSAVEAGYPGLPGNWCVLAADLAERSGDAARAAELLLEAGRRHLGVGALATAEQTLTRARTFASGQDTAVAVAVDETLTEVLAASGQVQRAIGIGRGLLTRLDTLPPARSADLHLQIARAAMAGGRWADAEDSVRIARSLAPPDMARVDVCAALVAVGRGDVAEARRLAESALRSAEASRSADVECEALEVIGRLAQQHDLAEAERAYARAATIAAAHDLHLPHARAVAALGAIEALAHGSLDRLYEARALAAEQGAIYLTAFVDLQILGPLLKQFRADEALEVASECADLSRRFHLIALPEALHFQAAAHALRGQRDEMEASIAAAIEMAMPGDVDEIVGCAWGRCRAMMSLLDEDLERAWTELSTGAELLLDSPVGPAPPFLGLWPLVGALLGRDAAAATAQVRAGHLTRHKMIADMLGYTEAILAGRAGRAAEADAAFAKVDAQVGPLDGWFRQYARRIAAQAALADGWGDPVSWLREAAAFFEARGHDRIAAACRGLLRQAGAPVPRRRPGDEALPERLRALGVTGREADVLGLLAEGLTNREIGERMFLSPRTVEKHVASLLIKTGLRRRSQLAGYMAGLDG